MTKLTLNSVGSLIDATTAAQTINTNSNLIVNAVQNTLSLDGTAPNAMGAPIDMNSNQMINLPSPATTGSPLRLADLNSFIGGGTITNIPVGGNTGDRLVKTSNVNYQIGWTPESASVLAGNNILVTGTSPITVATTLTPTFTIPSLGTALATTINKVAITTPATGSTLTIPDGVTLTGPAASGTAMTLGNTETVTGIKTFGSAGAVGRFKLAGTTSGTTVVDATAVASGTLTLPAATDTLVGKATTDTLTNKTFNSTATGNVLQVSGITVSSGQYPGEPTTGNATAGNVGEFVSSTVLVGSAVSLTNGTAANVTSISLTAGDWDICGNACFHPAGTTTWNSLQAWISTTSAPSGVTAPNNGAFTQLGMGMTTGADQFVPIGTQRLSLSGTTTVFLTVLAGFGVSTNTCYGFLCARRCR